MARTDRAIAAALERMRVSGLPAGAMVSQFDAMTSSGDRFDDGELRGAWNIVSFLESGCTSCESFVQDIAAGNAPRSGHRLIVVTSTPEDADLLSRANADRRPVVLLQRNREVSRAFESDRTPHFFVVDSRGIVRGSGWPNTWEGVSELVAAAEEGGGASDRPTLVHGPVSNEREIPEPVGMEIAERKLDLQEARMR
jgi:hypothetical protein